MVISFLVKRRSFYGDPLFLDVIDWCGFVIIRAFGWRSGGGGRVCCLFNSVAGKCLVFPLSYLCLLLFFFSIIYLSLFSSVFFLPFSSLLPFSYFLLFYSSPFFFLFSSLPFSLSLDGDIDDDNDDDDAMVM